MSQASEVRDRLSALDFGKLAREVAQHLDGWTLEEPKEDEDRPTVAHLRSAVDPEARVWLSLSRWPVQITASGDWPRAEGWDWRDFAPRDTEQYRIHVSPFRSAASIAKDISRRLLSQYLTTFTEQKQKRDDAVAKQRAASNLATELGQILVAEARYSQDRWRLWLDGGGAVEVTKWGSVSWELGQDANETGEAIALARFIRAQREARPKEAE